MEFLTKEELSNFLSDSYKIYCNSETSNVEKKISLYKLEGFTCQIEGKTVIHEFVRFNCFKREPIEIPEEFYPAENLSNLLYEYLKLNLEEFLLKYRCNLNLMYYDEYRSYGLDLSSQVFEKLYLEGYQEFKIKFEKLIVHKVFVNTKTNHLVVYSLNDKLIYDKTNSESYIQPTSGIPYIDSDDVENSYDELDLSYQEDYNDSDVIIKNILCLSLIRRKYVTNPENAIYDKKTFEGNFIQMWRSNGIVQTMEPEFCVYEDPALNDSCLLFHISEETFDNKQYNSYILVNFEVKIFNINDRINDFICCSYNQVEILEEKQNPELFDEYNYFNHHLTMIGEKNIYILNVEEFNNIVEFRRLSVENLIGNNWKQIGRWSDTSMCAICHRNHRFNQHIPRNVCCQQDEIDFVLEYLCKTTLESPIYIKQDTLYFPRMYLKKIEIDGL